MSPNPRSPRKRRRKRKKKNKKEKKNQTPVNFSLNNKATWILFMGEGATLWVNCSLSLVWDDEAPCKCVPHTGSDTPREHTCKKKKKKRQGEKPCKNTHRKKKRETAFKGTKMGKYSCQDVSIFHAAWTHISLKSVFCVIPSVYKLLSCARWWARATSRKVQERYSVHTENRWVQNNLNCVPMLGQIWTKPDRSFLSAKPPNYWIKMTNLLNQTSKN